MNSDITSDMFSVDFEFRKFFGLVKAVWFVLFNMDTTRKAFQIDEPFKTWIQIVP